ncbi:3'-5' exonuclease [Geopseudomonas aromaticivorans]
MGTQHTHPGMAFGVPAEFPGLQALARQLQRSLTIIDLETTGFMKSDGVPPGIVELAYLRVTTAGEVHSYQHLVNPEMPIPWQASRVHGIKDSDVARQPTFARHAHHLADLFATDLVCGFGSRRFDVPVIKASCLKRGIPVYEPAQLDVREVWTGRRGGGAKGTLGEVARHFGVTVGEAHRAGGDVLTTANLLEAMLKAYGVEAVLRAAINIDQAASVVVQPPEPRPETVSAPRRPTAGRPRPAQISNAIMEHVDSTGRIKPTDFESLASNLGCTHSAISFEVSGLLGAGRLTCEQVEDVVIQQRIAYRLEDAIEMVGGADRLKPLKTALDMMMDEPVCYVQLRAALIRREEQSLYIPAFEF